MSQEAHWKTRLLIAYSACCLIGHLLLLAVFAIYLASMLIMAAEDGTHWVVVVLQWTLLLAMSVLNCFALYYQLQDKTLTPKRLRFIAAFSGVLVAAYALLAVFSSVAALAWTWGMVALLLLPCPVLLSRPGILDAIRSLPVDEDDIEFYE